MNIPEDLKQLYGALSDAPLHQGTKHLIERIAQAEQAVADKYRLGFEDCRAQAMHVVDEHDGYLERIGNLEPTLPNPALKLESE
jgi:hypothetical protein